MLLKKIEEVLSCYKLPDLDISLADLKAIKKISIENNQINVSIMLGHPVETVKAHLIASLQECLSPHAHGHSINLDLDFKVNQHGGKEGIAAIPGVKNILAVASGKGGVGKSTLAVNVALALQKEGARVGLLDADIYGPSQPGMLGAQGMRPIVKEKRFTPIMRHGLQTISIGYLIDENAAMVWRGPMLGKAIQQLLHDTAWDNLDYLIVDLPPGTGDVQLTLCQKMPVSGAMIVTTPQDIALLDVRRACEMFNQMGVPIIGVVENMSQHICQNCGHAESIFGSGGGNKLAQEYGLELLGKVPLKLDIRVMTDQGHPTVAQEQESEETQLFCQIARRLAGQLSLQKKNYSSLFSKVVVTHNNS